MLKHDEVKKIIQKRFSLDAVTASETATQVISDLEDDLEDEQDVDDYLDRMEMLGDI